MAPATTGTRPTTDKPTSDDASSRAGSHARHLKVPSVFQDYFDAAAP